MLKRIPEIFLRPFPYGEKIELFRKVLYVFLLINALTLLPISHELFSYDGIVGAQGWNTKYPWYQQGSKALLNILNHPINSGYPWIAYVFVYGQIALIVSGLLNFLPRLTAVLLYFVTANLFIKGYLMFTGGEALISILLFYLMFISNSSRKQVENRVTVFPEFQNVLNNTFYWVILIQICVLYFFSDLYKLMDPYWLNGEALMHISKVEAFSGPAMRAIFADNPTISMFGTYIVLLYQGLFPLLVWFKRIKIPFLAIGVLLHVGIAIGMGIFTFGVLMILTYLLFLDQRHIQWLKKRFSLKKRT
ncbi:MAG: hypothetical protein GQ574_02365 [Crocinitomix sp.]|nr:hypothetical protein [Crocinitomix sp.]